MGAVIARDRILVDETETGATGLVRKRISELGGPKTVVLIERIIVRSDSASASVFTLYRGASPDFENTLDTTTAGNRAIADEAAPPFLSGQDDLLAEWTGLSAGARCVAVIQYRVELIETPAAV